MNNDATTSVHWGKEYFEKINIIYIRNNTKNEST